MKGMNISLDLRFTRAQKFLGLQAADHLALAL
jgi:hypothetical protein